MFESLKQLFGLGPKADFAELMREGAVIIDVRSKGEFQGGHIRGAKNFPLQNLKSNLKKIRTDKPIITCCASGARSASAKSILKANGYTNVHNGGGWMRLRNKIN